MPVRRRRRARPAAYDDRLLIRAITLGGRSAGNRLHVAMPRYRLTRRTPPTSSPI